MNEHFLSFIWKHSYFKKTTLVTTKGESLNVISPGVLNTNSGPDFDRATVQIDDLSWQGKIELHVRSSDWKKHKHQFNRAFNTVILHVVWEHDEDVRREDGTSIPTLELKHYVNPDLINSYEILFSENQFIPCEKNFHTVKRITKLAFLDSLLTKRLERKGQLVLKKLKLNHEDWRETTFQQVAGVFGIKVNQKAFEQLAERTGYKVIQKHRGDLLQIEALLFGQAGFLTDDLDDNYHKMLKKEHEFLRKKYKLAEPMNSEAWKFSKMRPSSFPTLRIARLAALLNSRTDTFMQCLDVTDDKIVKQWLAVEVSPYWKNNLYFSKPSKNINTPKILVNNLIINAIVPIKVAYALKKSDESYLHQAVTLLEKLGVESNAIESHWKQLGMPQANACDSQASLELYNEYCMQKKCLNCAIGVELMKSNLN